MAIAIFVTLTAQAGRGGELFDRANEIMADVRAEPGCLLAVVLRDPDHADTLSVFEVYRDEAALDAHRSMPHMTTKAPALRALYGAPLQARFFQADPAQLPLLS